LLLYETIKQIQAISLAAKTNRLETNWKIPIPHLKTHNN
jgi:hypothetical protein